MDLHNTPSPSSSGSNGSKGLLIFLWVVSLALVSGFSFMVGKNTPDSTLLSMSQVPTPANSGEAQAQTEATPPVPSVDLNGICKKSGASQKSEYLRPYTVQAGDSLQSIAEKELGDATRIDELTKLNAEAAGLTTVGSTLYLPPEGMEKTSGNLFQASGMIVRLDNSVWQISYGGGVKGLGIAIPTYYFSEVTNKNDFAVGDCVVVFMDNGVQVYKITKQ